MIDIAISPCPNDTFLFDAWINGKIDSPLTPKVSYADIQELNRMAQEQAPSVIKMSCFGFSKVCDRYDLLPVGAAIGRFGPKLIAKEPITTLTDKTVCIPGKDTTAFLLFQILCEAPKAVIECRFDQIPLLLQQGKADAGLIIHETRFTFQKLGLVEICDLGELFFERYGLPVPLGVVAIRKDVPSHDIITSMQKSLRHAQKFQDLSFVLQHSQEKDIAVIKQHIDTYVNEETYRISETGQKAIQTVLQLSTALLYKSPLSQ